MWAWTQEQDTPVVKDVLVTKEKQTNIRFSPYTPYELATTGPKQVCFWNWENMKLEGYVGKISKTDFGHYSGKLTTTIFLGSSGNALSSTDEGYVILWETQYATVLLDNPGDKLMRTASKVMVTLMMMMMTCTVNDSLVIEIDIDIMILTSQVIRLVESGISTMQTINDYVVIACADGAVRFYDFFLRLEAWFEDFAAGPLTSLSFSVQDCPLPEGEAGVPGLQFWVPDFVVGTADAFVVGAEVSLFDEVKAEDRRGTLLMQGMSDAVTSVACHPSNPLLAISCGNGSVQMWDYDMKILINLREFNSRKPPSTAPATARPGKKAAIDALK